MPDLSDKEVIDKDNVAEYKEEEETSDFKNPHLGNVQEIERKIIHELSERISKKVSGNEFANLVDDGIFGGDVEQFIDTGSYVFNALLSGSIYGGLPANKITAIAGESATGKTFFTLGLVKRFLDMNEKAGVIYFESESALTSDMLREREIDVNRVIHIPVSTVEEFRIQSSQDS